MKNQIFEALSEPELQETIGGGIMSWLTSCFQPQRVTPMQIRSQGNNYWEAIPEHPVVTVPRGG